MGIIIGAFIGYMSSDLWYNISPIFLVIIGGIIGFLLQNVYRARAQIDELKEQLENTINRLNNYINPKKSKTSDKVDEPGKQASPISAARKSEQIDIIAVHSEETPNNIASDSKETAVKVVSDSEAATTTIVAGSDETTASQTHSVASVNETLFNAGPQAPNNEDTPVVAYTSHTSQSPHPHPFTEKLVNFFTGDNAVLHAGIVILFLGIAFLLKYAAEHSMFPVWLRLVGVSVMAIIILGLGWRLKTKRESYALAMQGAGIGILYLNIFGALKLTDLLPAPVAFFLLIAVCVFSAILAIIQNSKSLATMGAIGGFLAPILASTGSGKYYLLFSYYLLLDSGILAIAWYKAWRSLNMIGFIFTFGIGLVWGVKNYQPGMFWLIELFLLAFFIQFLVISILFAIKQPEKNKGYVDGSLVFGSPLLVFGLQTYLLKTLPNPVEFGMAFIALGLAIIYIFISLLFAKTKTKHYNLFSEATLALGVMFATITIPLALNDGLWTSATWALEGVALLWVGIRQNKLAARLFGVGLQFLAGISFLIYTFKIKLTFLDVFSSHSPLSQLAEADIPLAIINSFYMGSLTIVIAGMIASYLLFRNIHKIHNDESLMSPVLLLWSMAWWFLSANSEINRFALVENYFYYKLMFTLLSCTGFYFIARQVKWPHLQWISNLVSPTLFITTIGLFVWGEFSANLHPLQGKGLFVWPLSFALFYLIFYFKDKTKGGFQVSREHYLHHTFAYLNLLAIIAFEILWRTHNILSGSDWNMQTWMMFTLGSTLALFVSGTQILSKRVSWPFKSYQRSYLWYSMRIVAILLFIWMGASTFTMTADPTPLPYFPLINPIELLQAFSFLILLSWVYRLRNQELFQMSEDLKARIPGIMGILVFLWLNSFIVRVLGHWGGVGFSIPEMVQSALAQATFSIVWSLLALLSMFYATKKHFRGIWFGGAIVLALVVVKLFLIDLKSVETLGRIISFLGVGTLLLLIGYLAPLPPAKLVQDSSDNNDEQACLEPMNNKGIQ